MDEPEDPILAPLPAAEEFPEDDISSLARSESRVEEGQREGRRRKLSRSRSASGQRRQGRRGRQEEGRRDRQDQGRRPRQEGVRRDITGRRGRQGFPISQRLAEEESRHYDGYADFSQSSYGYPHDAVIHPDPVYPVHDFSDFAYSEYPDVSFYSQEDVHPDYYYY